MYCSIADILRFHEINISSVIVRVRSIKSSFAAAFYRLTNRRHLSKDPFCYVIFCRIAASDAPKPEDYASKIGMTKMRQYMSVASACRN